MALKANFFTNSVSSPTEFEKILRKKLEPRKNLSSEPATSSSPFSSLKWERFMGEWAPSAEAKKTIQDAYPQKKTQKRESVKQIKLETQEAKEALQFFQRNGELIIRDTQDEKGLKRAFRRLAKKMHPDTGAAASNEAFIQLKKAHAQLESCLA